MLNKNIHTVGEGVLLYRMASCLAALTTLLCNKGSGSGHHFGQMAFIVTEYHLNNLFLVNSFVAHFDIIFPFYYVMISHKYY